MTVASGPPSSGSVEACRPSHPLFSLPAPLVIVLAIVLAVLLPVPLVLPLVLPLAFPLLGFLGGLGSSSLFFYLLPFAWLVLALMGPHGQIQFFCICSSLMKHRKPSSGVLDLPISFIYGLGSFYGPTKSGNLFDPRPFSAIISALSLSWAIT